MVEGAVSGVVTRLVDGVVSITQQSSDGWQWEDGSDVLWPDGSQVSMEV